jgi:hypothetical protein
VPDPGGRDRSLHGLNPGREVEECWHAAEGLQRVDDDRCGIGRGQQHPDPLARLRDACEVAAERHDRGHEPVVAQNLPAQVLDGGKAPAVPMPRA